MFLDIKIVIDVMSQAGITMFVETVIIRFYGGQLIVLPRNQ